VQKGREKFFNRELIKGSSHDGALRTKNRKGN